MNFAELGTTLKSGPLFKSSFYYCFCSRSKLNFGIFILPTFTISAGLSVADIVFMSFLKLRLNFNYELNLGETPTFYVSIKLLSF